MTEDLDRVSQLYQAAVIAAEPRPDRPAFGMLELARYLTDPAMVLTHDQTRRLFADKALRQGYAELKAALTIQDMPAVLAASDGVVEQRELSGGQLSLIPSSRAGQVYLRIRFSAREVPERCVLIAETAAGTIVKLPIIVPFGETDFLLTLNAANPEHALLIDALGDPRTKGSILGLERP